jgi:hypothetical protein
MGLMLDYVQATLPPWIAKGPLVRIGGRLYQRTMAAFGQVGDGLRDDAGFAVKEAMLEECTPDAYPAHLRNSNLQVVTGETSAQQLAVLRRRWLTSREIGGYEGMLGALARIGYPDAEIWPTLELKISGVINPFNNLRNFFYVRANQPNIWEPGELYDGGALYETAKLWALGGGTKEDLGLLIFTIQKFKPYTHTCRFVEIERTDGKVVRIPMHEKWERQANGAWRQYYNHSATTP